MQAFVPPTPAQTERALAEVYARPEFAPAEPSPLRRWLSELWAQIREWFGALWPDVNLSPGGQRIVFWAVVAFLAIAAVAIAVFLVGEIAGVWKGRTRSRKAPASTAAMPPARGDAAEWEARARQAAAEGRWREAALALYQALLLRLDQQGAIRYDAAKTPGEYRREARARGNAEMLRLLDGFLRLWEPIAFGGRMADGASYEQLRAAVGGLARG